MTIETIRELVGYEPDSPDRAAERDVKEIMEGMSPEFEALISTLLLGAARP